MAGCAWYMIGSLDFLVSYQDVDCVGNYFDYCVVVLDHEKK